MSKSFGLIFLVVSVLFFVFPLACQKTYSVAPLSANPPTATFTPTLTPCGYPGNICTPTFTSTSTFTSTPTATATNSSTATKTNTPTITFTPTNTATSTSTGTPTNTYTITNTPTITPTSSVLLPPQGVLGIMDPTGTGKYEVLWLQDTDPRITNYVIYTSSTGSAGSYSAAITVAKSGANVQAVINNLTTFNTYLYVVSRGSLPDSVPSRVVHAVSGTTSTNSYIISASNSSAPTFTITGGSVAGAVKRTWLVPQVPPYYYWFWGDEGAPMVNSVTYGYSGTGTSYVTPAPLPGAANYSLILYTFNSENWNIDVTTISFSTP
ncbi:MAG TPA: hypothetical protein VMV05_01740 [bacterium]|nr:hypothetical protein [bacterium]